jgi:hypothetical protein
MVRILNTVCVALMGLSILALYHVSERTRVASVELRHVERSIASERSATSVLQAEWERVAGPARIEALAARDQGDDKPQQVQLSSFDQLPRHGDDTPLTNTPIRQASVQSPVPAEGAGF